MDSHYKYCIKEINQEKWSCFRKSFKLKKLDREQDYSVGYDADSETEIIEDSYRNSSKQVTEMQINQISNCFTDEMMMVSPDVNKNHNQCATPSGHLMPSFSNACRNLNDSLFGFKELFVPPNTFMRSVTPKNHLKRKLDIILFDVCNKRQRKKVYKKMNKERTMEEWHGHFQKLERHQLVVE